jgi:hypothetical protein
MLIAAPVLLFAITSACDSASKGGSVVATRMIPPSEPPSSSTRNATSQPHRGANVAVPAVEGPVRNGTGSPFVAATTFDLAEVGYVQAEYFISQTATAYVNQSPLGEDGLWSVGPGETAPYKTRILVYRPVDSARFNGTVILEWLNVSGGLDSAADWIMAHTEMIREGYAWVGVSAQFVGVEGGPSIVGLPSMPLKTVDPARYGSLVHPGDSFSYDIFSQAGRLFREPSNPRVLGEDFAVEKLIAVGESQSAFRLVTYINAIHPVAGVYDGFLVHSRGAFAAPLSEKPGPEIPVPGSPRIRADVDVPVLIFQTETDLTLLQSFACRQPDSQNIRLWEVAGTAHADTYTIVVGPKDRGSSPDAARLIVTSTPLAGFACKAPINSGPHHFVLNAAFHALHRWVRNGVSAPRAPRIEVEPGPPAAIRRDAHGNALGGIRAPSLAAPTATLSGEGQEGSLFCQLFGTTAPFAATTLGTLYANRTAYLAAFRAACSAAVAAGFLLPADAELMTTAAALSPVPDAPDGVTPEGNPIAIPDQAGTRDRKGRGHG